MSRKLLVPMLASLLSLIAMPALAAPVSKAISYEIGDQKFEGRLVYDNASKKLRPGLLMSPNWMGPTEAAFKQAQAIAGKDYVIFVADMYGAGARPKNSEEAGTASKLLYGDAVTMRARIEKALEVLKAQAGKAPIDLKRIGAIGFCFGGTNVLELARSGNDIAGVVSFHGGLSPAAGAASKPITAKVLALHGADDPFVPADQVAAFEQEMRDAKVDWELVKFGGAVHSFSDPDAHMVGKADYNPVVAQRAFRLMNDFFKELFAKK
ncbi:MAG: dienelactone hydrolase family protein [Pseudomonadota bacterium]